MAQTQILPSLGGPKNICPRVKKSKTGPASFLNDHSSVARDIVIGVALLVLAVLLFARLGTYSVWDDEALTALEAKAVMQTGDTSIKMEHGNLVGSRGGNMVVNFADRSDPPLESYLVAPAFAVFGVNSWSARLPFALMGLGTFALMLLWARRESLPSLSVLIVALVTNVSLILYFRQSRYYGAVIFFSTAVVYVYWRCKPTPRVLLSLAGLSVLLFASNCLCYVALYGCLAVDYLIWKRKDWPPTWRNALLLFGPQVVLNALIASVWNPLRTEFGGNAHSNTIWDRFTILFWYWRDTNCVEFFNIPLLILALVLGWKLHRMWMLRGCLALVLYVSFIAMTSPQPVNVTTVADVRYVSAMIPLALALEAGAIWALLGRWPWMAVGAAVLVFSSNFFNGGVFFYSGVRSTLACYVGELLHPVPEPYSPTADWINANVPDGESVWVLPQYATYPLMFDAPRALYAWQFDWPARPDFAQLPSIHFKGQVPPDYLVAFGPYLAQMAQALQSWNRPDLHYTEVTTLPVFWKDLYRPELFWRSFTPVGPFDPNTYGVHIFKRTSPPIVPAAQP
jgi:4-amino-4-deoxy-L-arabinose transferase-like glycosyltransferase